METGLINDSTIVEPLEVVSDGVIQSMSVKENSIVYLGCAIYLPIIQIL